MMNHSTKTLLLSAIASAGMVASASADTILSAVFTEPGYDEAGGNTSGTTASNIPWTSDFAQTGGDLIFSGSAAGFINEGNSDADALGILGNIETGGSWTGSFAFTPDQDFDVTGLSILSYAISGTGAHQTLAQSYQFSATISDIGGTVASFAASSTVEAGGTGGSTFNLTPGSATTLNSGTEYTIAFTAAYATGDGAQNGNNIALGSIELQGVVPEPGSLALLGLGGLCVLRRRRD